GGPCGGHQYLVIASVPTIGAAPWAGSRTASGVNVERTPVASPRSQAIRYASRTSRTAWRSFADSEAGQASAPEIPVADNKKAPPMTQQSAIDRLRFGEFPMIAPLPCAGFYSLHAL